MKALSQATGMPVRLEVALGRNVLGTRHAHIHGRVDVGPGGEIIGQARVDVAAGQGRGQRVGVLVCGLVADIRRGTDAASRDSAVMPPAPVELPLYAGVQEPA